MKRWLSWLDATRGALWYVTLVVIVPMLALLVAGLIFLWQNDYLLVSMALWLAVTLVAYLGLVNWPRRQMHAAAARHGTSNARKGRSADDGGAEPAEGSAAAADGFEQLPDQLAARGDWSAHDREVWQSSCRAIEEALEAEPTWNELTAIALHNLSLIAAAYHGKKSNATYRFTLPEALLVVSVASARYRRLIQNNVPYADRVKIGTVVSLVRRQDSIKTGFTWYNRIRRTVRLVNPVGAVIGEIRDHITDRVLNQVGGAVQTTLKRLLLQEISQVGIDLYSGRLRVSDEELHDYRSEAARADEERRPESPEPLRVLVLGQTSAGKSSLVNALVDSLAAETGRLPTTDRTSVHTLKVEDGSELHLIDTPGVEMDDDKLAMLAEVALDADLILVLARATQPARAADVALLAAIDARFEALPARRRPPIMLVLTHADTLPPRNEWSPPYDLDTGLAGTGADADVQTGAANATDTDGTTGAGISGNSGARNRRHRKAATIREALISVRGQLKLPDDTLAIPVCLLPSRGLYNIDLLGAQLMALNDAATQTQFNRRRLERGARSVDWSARLRQAGNLGRVLGRAVIRRGK